MSGPSDHEVETPRRRYCNSCQRGAVHKVPESFTSKVPLNDRPWKNMMPVAPSYRPVPLFTSMMLLRTPPSGLPGRGYVTPVSRRISSPSSVVIVKTPLYERMPGDIGGVAAPPSTLKKVVPSRP